MQKGRLTPLEDEFKRLVADKTGRAKGIAKEFYHFWDLYGGLYQTNHLKHVEKLYFTANQNLTEISYDVHVEDRTLYGYRIRYMDLFMLLAERYNYTIKSDK